MAWIDLAHLLVSKIGIFGVALLWGIKAAVSWMLIRWWKLRRAALR
ncbi:MAG: hypothetical protein AB7E21_01930 [Pseudodonghicola sp.]|jgi:hypothetical protein